MGSGAASPLSQALGQIAVDTRREIALRFLGTLAP